MTKTQPQNWDTFAKLRKLSVQLKNSKTDRFIFIALGSYNFVESQFTMVLCTYYSHLSLSLQPYLNNFTASPHRLPTFMKRVNAIFNSYLQDKMFFLHISCLLRPLPNFRHDIFLCLFIPSCVFQTLQLMWPCYKLFVFRRQKRE